MQKKLGIKNQGKTGKTRCVQINYKSFVRHTFTAKEYLQKQIFNLESKTKQKKMLDEYKHCKPEKNEYEKCAENIQQN